jgi:hypothetical protein
MMLRHSEGCVNGTPDVLGHDARAAGGDYYPDRLTDRAAPA